MPSVDTIYPNPRHKPSRQFLQGLLTAAVAIAEVTGRQPMKGMTDREWKLISNLTKSVIDLAKIEAERLDGTRT